MSNIICKDKSCGHNFDCEGGSFGVCEISPEIVMESCGHGVCKGYLEKTPHKELCDMLYDLANTICGGRGKSTQSALSVTNEEYVVCVVHSDNKDHLAVHFERWIRGYKEFASGIKREGERKSYEPPVIYWRTTPEIRDGNYVGCQAKYELYARLLITTKRQVVIFGNHELSSYPQDLNKEK